MERGSATPGALDGPWFTTHPSMDHGWITTYPSMDHGWITTHPLDGPWCTIIALDYVYVFLAYVYGWPRLCICFPRLSTCHFPISDMTDPDVQYHDTLPSDHGV